MKGKADLEFEMITGTRMRVNWERLISRNNLYLPRLLDNHCDSLRLGNGDIGAAITANAGCLVMFVGKNDILDYRKKATALSPDTTASSLAGIPMPTTKPAGWIRFRNKGKPRDPDIAAQLDIWNAEVRTTDEFQAFVSKNRNLIAVEYRAANNGMFDIELARNRDTTGVIDPLPEFGAEGCDFWVRHAFPPDPDTYPAGFEYVMYARVLCEAAVESEIIREFAVVRQSHSINGLKGSDAIEDIVCAHVRTSGPITLFVSVMTTRDAPDPMAAAIAEADAAEHTGISGLRREHAEAWHDFWRRSFVQLEGRDFLNRQWFLSLYHLASATRPGSVGPGLFGPWSNEDFPPWGNDRHWDYNAQAALWGVYSCNRMELAEAYNDEIFDLLPSARMMARDFYGGIEGAKFPIVGWPRSYKEPAASRTAEFTTPWINGFTAQPLWWYYQYSRNKDFLRDKGYPVIKASAEFYENFVELAADGKYDMPPTAVWDLAFMVPDAKNAIIDLAFAKMLLRTAISASEELGVDEDRRADWEHVAANLRDYPTTVIDGKDIKPVDHRAGRAKAYYTTSEFPSGEVMVAYEGYPVIEYNLSPWTMPIYPSGEFGLHSTQQEQELARRTVRITPYYLWDDLVMLSMARVRLGENPLEDFEKHTRYILHENGCQSYPRECWASKYIFMHFLGWPAVINECLVQSYTGRIRIAPVKLTETARFARLRAVGGFLVSGEIRSGGRIAYVAVTSEAGQLCELARPWDGVVRVRNAETMAEVAITEEGETVIFPTQAGSTYIIDHPVDPWDRQPLWPSHGQLPERPLA